MNPNLWLLAAAQGLFLTNNVVFIAVNGLVGLSLAPLYPSVPEAALRDAKLSALLTLFDAIRSGQARERNTAHDLLAGFFN